MKVDLRKKVKDFQEEFKSEFGLGVRIYASMNKGANKADPEAQLFTLNEAGTKGGDMDFAGNTKVKNVEEAFTSVGIQIQVEDKNGKLADNEATLASLK